MSEEAEVEEYPILALIIDPWANNWYRYGLILRVAAIVGGIALVPAVLMTVVGGDGYALGRLGLAALVAVCVAVLVCTYAYRERTPCVLSWHCDDLEVSAENGYLGPAEGALQAADQLARVASLLKRGPNGGITRQVCRHAHALLVQTAEDTAVFAMTRRVLDTVPDHDPQRPEVEERLSRLEERLARCQEAMAALQVAVLDIQASGGSTEISEALALAEEVVCRTQPDSGEI